MDEKTLLMTKLFNSTAMRWHTLYFNHKHCTIFRRILNFSHSDLISFQYHSFTIFVNDVSCIQQLSIIPYFLCSVSYYLQLLPRNSFRVYGYWCLWWTSYFYRLDTLSNCHHYPHNTYILDWQLILLQWIGECRSLMFRWSFLLLRHIFHLEKKDCIVCCDTWYIAHVVNIYNMVEHPSTLDELLLLKHLSDVN